MYIRLASYFKELEDQIWGASQYSKGKSLKEDFIRDWGWASLIYF
jgi:hypothetical protein